MATISWNEIRKRAVKFVHDNKGVESEAGESQSFWNDFFRIFGVNRREVALFEKAVKKLDANRRGRIDLFWPGKLIVEQKSRGRDLDLALDQAVDYGLALSSAERPRFIIVSDFARMRLHALDFDDVIEFDLDDLPDHVEDFGFIAGYRTQPLRPEDPVNIAAAEKMGKLHDALKASGYDGHPLEVLLVRILFLLFAEDTRVFEDIRGFEEWIRQRTAADGSDLGSKLAEAFQVLNTPHEKRSAHRDELLARFPYVNGLLFEETIPIAAFDKKMRTLLLDACEMDWSAISPSIFGAMFQSIMDKKKRRNLGAHYTSEENILKAIGPLFLDDLWAEFDKAKRYKARLKKLHGKLRRYRFLDPACGCGNFLVVAYRELRRLELEILRQLKTDKQFVLDVDELIQLNVDQFYGIEIEEFPARIAEVALWLTDHQMNMKVGQEFGSYFVRVPLRASPHILNANALREDWRTCFGDDVEFDFIFGNPPFAGQTTRAADQTSDLRLVCGKEYARWLDYVVGWYWKAAEYLSVQPQCRCALVSTNSVVQGEVAARLWEHLLACGVEIDFAHRTFVWWNEAGGKAVVHCVIIGFSLGGLADQKLIFEYPDIKGEPTRHEVNQVNTYLADARTVLVQPRARKRLSPHLPETFYGNKPSDGGHLIVTEDDYPHDDGIAQKYILPFVGTEALLHDEKRWCIWIPDAEHAPDMNRSAFLKERIRLVAEFRNDSTAEDTRKAAARPYRFFRVPQPDKDYVAIPRHVAENRLFFTVAYLPADVIVSDSCFAGATSPALTFGILSSSMFTTWLKAVGGRIKSDPRFSGSMVYNTFPLPEVPDKVRSQIEKNVQSILDAREAMSDRCLADMYDPNAMSSALLKAHRALDKTVDRLFRPSRRTAFSNNTERLDILLEDYEKMVGEEAVARKKQTRRKKS